MRDVVFFDVDGTLLPGGAGRIPEGTEAALRRLRANGVGIVLCTGRHPQEIARFEDIPFDGYVLLNGQLCLDGDKRPIFTNPIVSGDRRELLGLFDGREVPVILVEIGRQYMNVHSPEAAAVQSECDLELYPIGEHGDAEILMATVFTDREIRIGGLQVARWHRWACDVYNRGDGKSRGVRFFLERFGVARERSYAFGDAHNDIDMLECVGTGIAMGNAYEATKRAADYVTDDCDRDGVRKALEHFGLI